MVSEEHTSRSLASNKLISITRPKMFSSITRCRWRETTYHTVPIKTRTTNSKHTLTLQHRKKRSVNVSNHIFSSLLPSRRVCFLTYRRHPEQSRLHLLGIWMGVDPTLVMPSKPYKLYTWSPSWCGIWNDPYASLAASIPLPQLRSSVV